MNHITIILNTILLFTLLNIFASCDRQKKSEHPNSTLKNLRTAILAIGNNVASIDNSILSIFRDQQSNNWLGRRAAATKCVGHVSMSWHRQTIL